MNMRQAALGLVLLLALTGCSSATTTTTEPEAAPSADCLEINEAAIAALNQGIIDPAVTLNHYAAVPSPDNTELWYVAATYTTADSEGQAVWITQYDPTTSDSNAYLSVDAVAEAISDYHRLEGADITAPGAEASITCLPRT